ncbi:MAG: VWA domain-containing protein [Bacteroidales bacterium]|nr:VWA domain-containing protein [Bacteroidales bacterium]
MIIFAASRYLLLLLLIPFFFVAEAVLGRLRKKRVRALGDEALVEALMRERSRSKRWIRCVLYSLAFFFFVIGLARPQIGAKLKEHKIRGAEIVIALDVSNSMRAEDYSPNRLERAKLAISRLADRLKDDRIGLVIFAGTSFVQLPVTADYVSAKMFLNSISTASVPVQGTAIGDAIHTAAKSFSAQSEHSRAIIIITDGENHEDDAVAAAREAAEAGIKVYAIGVGSADGVPIPTDDGLLRDSAGEIVVTRLDEPALKDIAAAGGGAYVHAGNEEFGLAPIVDDIRKMEAEEFSSVVFEEYDEQFMYFFAIALLFFVLEMLVGDRRPSRRLFEQNKEEVK